MCGFVAWADIQKNIQREKLEYLRDLLRHRGPDDYGCYISPDLRVGLGFRRLSIIDLSPAGHQPMSNEDGSIWIVFNGEVYNFGELRPELEIRGHLFRSRTDTEVILHAYEEWGEACVEKFIGMFAIVIWDARKGKLFAVRDRLGIKPLYYSATANGIVLASELKPIINTPRFNNELDAEALQDYLARGYISSPRTIFRFARSLGPGNYLLWSQDTGEISINRYWSPLVPISSDHLDQRSTEKDWIESLERLLCSSVKYHVISDVPLGVFLSGGIDSSLVAALMRQVSNSEVKTFTVEFEDEEFNEGKYARQIAERLGTTHTSLQARTQDAQNIIEILPKFFDEPFADSSQVPTLLVSKLARQHVTVALSGDGGDELFCGYETYRLMDHFQYLWRLPQPVRNTIRSIAGTLPNDRWKLAGVGLAMPDPVKFANYYNGIWRPQEIESLLPSMQRYNSPTDFESDYRANRKLLEKLMLIDLRRYLPNDILTKVDRASMAVSLETRVPLLDHRVVELALKMPLSMKKRNGQTKFALRQILYKYVPRELIDRPKHGFGIPLDQWLKTDLHGLLERYLDPSLLRMQGLFDVGVVQHQVERFMSGQAGHSRIWSLLMFQMWANRYLGLGA